MAGLSPELAAKVRIFRLVTPPAPPTRVCSARGRVVTPHYGPHTYVHAKCWVFDDELAVIGSANCNRRGWDHDTELNAFIFDDRVPAEASTRTFAQQLRMDLWAEHLALPPSRFVDGVTSAALWLRRPPLARVLPYCPDDDTDGFFTSCTVLGRDQIDPPAP
jgi:phosphatidylserine/phosphatidylglycerophosphate/cardiolipin synthase-like enzyme